MVGDPSGRCEERNLLDDATLDHNVATIKEQIERIVDFEPADAGRARRQPRLDGADVGPRVPARRRQARHREPDAGQGVGAGPPRQSEHGISFTEFSYMLLQANDFLRPHRPPSACELQIGGSDQYGNILSGIDLIRRTRQPGRAYGLTWPLITAQRRLEARQDDRRARCGSTRRKTSPYQFHQHWMQLPTTTSSGQLQLTFRPVAEIDELLAAQPGPGAARRPTGARRRRDDDRPWRRSCGGCRGGRRRAVRW